MKVKSEREVAQSCPTPSDPMDCSPSGASIPGIFQARVLEWVPLPSLYGILLSHKMNEVLLSAATQMDLEIIILALYCILIMSLIWCVLAFDFV